MDEFADLSMTPPKVVIEFMNQIAADTARPRKTFEQILTELSARWRKRYLIVRGQCKDISNYEAVELVMASLAQLRDENLWSDMQGWKDKRVHRSDTDAAVARAIAETQSQNTADFKEEAEKNRKLIERLLDNQDKDRTLIQQQMENDKNFQRELAQSLQAMTAALLKITDQSKDANKNVDEDTGDLPSA